MRDKKSFDCNHGDDEGIDVTEEFAAKFPKAWKAITDLVAEIESEARDHKDKGKTKD